MTRPCVTHQDCDTKPEEIIAAEMASFTAAPITAAQHVVSGLRTAGFVIVPVEPSEAMIETSAREFFMNDWPHDKWERMGSGVAARRYREGARKALSAALATQSPTINQDRKERG